MITQDSLEAEIFFRNYLEKHPVVYDGNFTEVQEFAVQFYRGDFSRMIITRNTLTLLNNEMFAKDLVNYYLMNPEHVSVMRKTEDVNLSFFVELIFLRFPVAKVGCLTKLQSLGLEFCKKYQVYSQFIFETKFAYWEDWCENNSKLSVAFLKGVMNIPDEELLENVFMLYRESNACHYRSTVRHDPENVFWTKGKSYETANCVDFSFGTNEIVPSHRQRNLREADFRHCTMITGFDPKYFIFKSDTFRPYYLKSEWPEYALPDCVPKNVQDAIYAKDFSLLGTDSLGMINVGDVLKDYLCNFNLTILERILDTLSNNSHWILLPSHWGYNRMPEEVVVERLIDWYQADSKWYNIVRVNDSTAEYIKMREQEEERRRKEYEERRKKEHEERRRREYEEWLELVAYLIRELNRR